MSNINYKVFPHSVSFFEYLKFKDIEYFEPSFASEDLIVQPINFIPEPVLIRFTLPITFDPHSGDEPKCPGCDKSTAKPGSRAYRHDSVPIWSREYKNKNRHLFGKS